MESILLFVGQDETIARFQILFYYDKYTNNVYLKSLLLDWKPVLYYVIIYDAYIDHISPID